MGGRCFGQDMGEFAQDGGADLDTGRLAVGLADVELDDADGVPAIGRLAAQPVATNGAEEGLAIGETGGGIVRGLPQQVALHLLDHRAVGTIHQRQFKVLGPLRLIVFQRLQQILPLEVELLDAAVIGKYVHVRLIANPDQVERRLQRLELQPVADAQPLGEVVLDFAQGFACHVVEPGCDRGALMLRLVLVEQRRRQLVDDAVLGKFVGTDLCERLVDALQQGLDLGGGGRRSQFGVEPFTQVLQYLPGFARILAVDAMTNFVHQQHVAPSAVQQFDHRIRDRTLVEARQQLAQDALLGDFCSLAAFAHFLQAEHAGCALVQQWLDHALQLGARLFEHARVLVGFGVDAVGPAAHQPQQALVRDLAVVARHHADAVERVQHLVRRVNG